MEGDWDIAHTGKVAVEGITEIHGEKVFALSLLQARKADYVKRPFFARYDREATWLTDLKPAFGERRFFFEQDVPALPFMQANGKGSTVDVYTT